MAWDDFLPSSWDEFINGTPNAAADARTAIAPATDSMRSSNGRFDPAVITKAIPENLQPDMKDYVGLESSLGNMRQGYIDQMRPTGGGINLGNLLRVAGVGVSYGQGNRDAGAAILQGLQSDAEKRQQMIADRQKMGLENADSVLSGVGKFGTDYLSKKLDMKVQLQQKAAETVARAAAMASVYGEDPSEAQAQAIRAITPQMRMLGHGDLADAYEKAYPAKGTSPSITPSGSSAPAPAAAPSPPPGPSASNTPLMAPPAGGQPGPTLAAAQAAQPTNAIPQPPAQTASQAQSAPPDNTVGSAARDMQRKALKLHMLGYETEAKYLDDQSKAELSKLEVKEFTNPDGTKSQFYINPQRPEEKPIPLENPALKNAPNDEGLTGDAWLAKHPEISPQMAARIKGIAQYRQAPVAASRGNSGAIMGYVQQFRPDYDAHNYGKVTQATTEYSQHGKTGKAITSANTVIHHLGEIYDVIDKLGNYDTLPDIANAAHAAYGSQFDKNYQAARARFEQAKVHVADELEAALRNGDTSEKGIQAIKDNIKATSSPTALKAAIAQSVTMLGDRLNQIKSARDIDLMDPDSSWSPLRGDSQKIFDRLQKGLKVDSGFSAPKAPEIDPKAIEMLQKNPTPEMMQKFDQTFGHGEAVKYLNADLGLQ